MLCHHGFGVLLYWQQKSQRLAFKRTANPANAFRLPEQFKDEGMPGDIFRQLGHIFRQNEEEASNIIH